MKSESKLAFRLPTIKEYEALQIEALGQTEQERLMEIASCVKDPATEPKLLGLHLQQKFTDKKLWPHALWYAGQVWLKLGEKPTERIVLRVEPKVSVRPYQMYLACLRHPLVRAHLGNCISIFWNEPPIPVNRAQYQITPLVVVRYLGLLYDLCQRNIRLTISPTEENLVGRIKGKPLVQTTMRRNQSNGRLDRVYCRFPLQSIDTMPNQILAAALHQATKYLHEDEVLRGDRDISRLAAYSFGTLSGVTLRRILPTDFKGLHYGGFLRPYLEPHRWAQMVLRLLGSDPLEEIDHGKQGVDLPPFAIDMNELFERFCEVGLRRVSHQSVWAGYTEHNRNLGSDFKVRPDFLVTEGNVGWIVDAKYKENWSWDREEHRPDVNQIVAYSRHREVLKQLNLNHMQDQRPRIVVLYPGTPEEKLDSWRGIDLQATSSIEAASGNDVLRDFQVAVVRTPVRLPA